MDDQPDSSVVVDERGILEEFEGDDGESDLSLSDSDEELILQAKVPGGHLKETGAGQVLRSRNPDVR